MQNIINPEKGMVIHAKLKKMFILNINYINKVSSCQKYKVKRYVI